MKHFILCLMALLALGATAQNEKTNKALNYITEHFSASGYAQGGWEYHQNHSPKHDFTVARIILLGNYKITDRWNAFIMADFRKFSLHELWMSYQIAPWMTVKLGQFKTPFSLENPISPVVMEMITQMSLAGNYMVAGSSKLMMPAGAGRDIGISLYGNAGKYVSYDLALMNGAGRNNKDDNSWKDVVARLTLHPVECLDLSGSIIVGKGSLNSVGDELDKTRFDNPNGDYTRNRYAAGFQLKTRPVNLRGEWMWGKDGYQHTNGGYATVQFNNVGVKNLDVVASVDHLDLPAGDTNRYQAGVQYWFYKFCRLQAAYAYTQQPGQQHEHSVLTQVQVAF